MSERFSLVVLVPLRLLCGVILLLEGWGKFQGGWMHGTALMRTLNGWLDAHKTYPFFVPVIHAALAHPKIFGTLVTVGELAIGVSMLLGLLSRLGAFLGTVMLFSFAFGAGHGLVPPGNSILMGAILATFVVAPPGRVFGVDQMLRARTPWWLV
jgi:thiosulfate dehydrogenase [quinone] large subunit